jgi:hypothetical protein
MLKRACPREEVNALLRSAMGNERTGALARIKVRRLITNVLKKLTRGLVKPHAILEPVRWYAWNLVIQEYRVHGPRPGEPSPPQP